MLDINIPGFGHLKLEHLVIDYNGTLAFDGRLQMSMGERLRELARDYQIHVVTADTFGSAALQLERLPVKLVVLGEAAQAEAKLDYIAKLDSKTVVAVGNGRNDALMIEAAALGIVVIQREGLAARTLLAADIAVSSVIDALNLLSNPRRLVATLRS